MPSRASKSAIEKAGSTTFDRPGSLFSPTASAWDHVFDSINDMPPLFSTRAPRKHPPSRPPLPEGPIRRQAMTTREISAFEDMFNMVFNAASDQPSCLPRQDRAVEDTPSDTRGTTSIGRHSKPDSVMGDLIGRLRRHSRKVRWTTESDELLDRKKEEMDLCDTDVQLLNWAKREIFDESKRYENAALQAIRTAASPAKNNAGSSQQGSGVDSDSDSNSSSTKTSPLELQPPTYPHLLAYLMRAFRERHHDPHLALSMFEHARRLSIPSYVFGCSTPAYNELIETRWRSFRDLLGVHDALEEMRVNGVAMDTHTRRLVEIVRREVGQRELLWNDFSEDANEKLDLFARIEALAAGDSGKRRVMAGKLYKRPTETHWDEWKSSLSNSHSDNDGDWEFDRWEQENWPRHHTNERSRLSVRQ
jgi:hypothetical protein